MVLIIKINLKISCFPSALYIHIPLLQMCYRLRQPEVHSYSIKEYCQDTFCPPIQQILAGLRNQRLDWNRYSEKLCDSRSIKSVHFNK